jgi:NitT/TauT family transport system substrate-binding protein
LEPIPELLPVGIGEQAIVALTSGHVQALGLWSNAYYAMERAGHSFRYFRHPTLADFGNIALMTSDTTIDDRRDELCGFSRGVAKASAFMVENPEAALRMYWTSVPGARTGEDEAEAVKNGMIELAQQVDDFNVGFPPESQFGVFDEAAFARYEELLLEQGLTNTTPPVSELVSDALVDCMNDFDYEEVRELAAGWSKDQ